MSYNPPTIIDTGSNYKTWTAVVDQTVLSPDGKYMAVIGEDSGLGSDRIVVFRGS